MGTLRRGPAASKVSGYPALRLRNGPGGGRVTREGARLGAPGDWRVKYPSGSIQLIQQGQTFEGQIGPDLPNRSGFGSQQAGKTAGGHDETFLTDGLLHPRHNLIYEAGIPKNDPGLHAGGCISSNNRFGAGELDFRELRRALTQGLSRNANARG